MKKTATRFGFVFSIIVIIVSMTILLNMVIASAQTIEDNKVVSEEAVSVPPVESAASYPEGKNVAWEFEKRDDGIEPDISDKDLDTQKLVNLMAKAVFDFFGADISDETLSLSVAEGVYWDKPILTGFCLMEDFSYNIGVNSVTGKVYEITRFVQSETAYPGAKEEVVPMPSMVLREPTEEEKSAMAIAAEKSSPEAAEKERLALAAFEEEQARMERLLSDSAYYEAASNFITEKIPGKTITNVKNVYLGSMSGNIGVNTISTAVDLTDGSGYMVTMGESTKTIFSLTYYPNGVVSFLKEEYKQFPDKLWGYDDLDK